MYEYTDLPRNYNEFIFPLPHSFFITFVFIISFSFGQNPIYTAQ